VCKKPPSLWKVLDVSRNCLNSSGAYEGLIHNCTEFFITIWSLICIMCPFQNMDLQMDCSWSFLKKHKLKNAYHIIGHMTYC
jgi:hypothetical protein